MNTFVLLRVWRRITKKGHLISKETKFFREQMFDHRDDALKVVRKILRKRRNHNYFICRISKGFPFVPELSDFPRQKGLFLGQQLDLF